MNMTFSAADEEVTRARKIAQEHGTTLNEEFRQWLKQYATSDERAQRLSQLFEDLADWRPGRTWTREERNAR